MNRRIRIWFVLLTGVILLLPAILTLKDGWIDFSDTGQIGDTIGGIMGPFVGILGAWLVYLSFQQQIEANRIQREALEEEKRGSRQDSNFDTLRTMITELKADYNQLVFETFTGKEAINEFNRAILNHQKHHLDGVFVLEYRYVLESVLYIHRCIHSFSLAEAQCSFLKYSLAFFVDNKLNHQAARTVKSMSKTVPSEDERCKYRIFNSAVKVRAINWQGCLKEDRK